MQDIHHQLANLTPEQRQLIELMLSRSDDHAPDSTSSQQPKADDAAAQQNRMIGPIPLTGPQKWFFENISDYYGDWWDKSALYEVPAFIGRSPELISKVFEHLLTYHDGLRAYFVQQETGWQQIIAEPGGQVPFQYMNLADAEPAEQDQAIQAASLKLQLGLNLSTPPLIAVMLVYLGENRPSRLLIREHHLIMDGISMVILAGDFQTAYEQLLYNKPVRLLPPTTSVQQYVEYLQTLARSNEMRQELESYWLNLPWAQVAPLPVDDPTGETRRTVRLMGTVQISLSAEETRILQTVIPRMYKVQISDIFLTVLMETITQWTGRSHQLIGWVDGSRGKGIFGQNHLDVSRTVGWLGLDSYLLLEQVPTRSPREALQAIQAQVRQIPHKGMGWYLLRYYGDAEMVERFRPLINNNMVIMFNYLGAMADPSGNQNDILHLLGKMTGIPNDQNAKDFHPRLFINALIAKGCFIISWEYNGSEYRQETIERITAYFKTALQALIASSHEQVPD